jgi:acyl dehydratase
VASEFEPGLIEAGETLDKTIRYTREDIEAFARTSLDYNPLHRDPLAAQRSRHGRIIASGEHTAAMLMGMLATHFSRSNDGLPREMLCLNMNFSFKAPVFADQDLALRWRVASVAWNAKLRGFLAHLDGGAWVEAAKPALVARGTILVQQGGR